MERIKEYALKNYPKMFQKKTVTRVKGKIVSTTITEIDPIVVDMGGFWYVKNHVDASGIVLSKNV